MPAGNYCELIAVVRCVQLLLRSERAHLWRSFTLCSLTDALVIVPATTKLNIRQPAMKRGKSICFTFAIVGIAIMALLFVFTVRV